MKLNCANRMNCFYFYRRFLYVLLSIFIKYLLQSINIYRWIKDLFLDLKVRFYIKV